MNSFNTNTIKPTAVISSGLFLIMFRPHVCSVLPIFMLELLMFFKLFSMFVVCNNCCLVLLAYTVH